MSFMMLEKITVVTLMGIGFATMIYHFWLGHKNHLIKMQAYKIIEDGPTMSMREIFEAEDWLYINRHAIKDDLYDEILQFLNIRITFLKKEMDNA